MSEGPSDAFMLGWAIFALLALVLITIASVPLLTHPERPWFGLDPPAAIGSAG